MLREHGVSLSLSLLSKPTCIPEKTEDMPSEKRALDYSLQALVLTLYSPPPKKIHLLILDRAMPKGTA